ncbi:carbonic anhydrase [bacterium SCSIO 12741]|nr:carbonic anhydrase [bacterium SCSIO 12741]
MITASEALDRLKEGNQRYTQDQLTHPNSDQDRRASQVGGQEPYAIILSCADSRVAPELIFDKGIGEIFVIRVAGNTANPSSMASIEYAVAHLKTPLIVVLGHQNCGACAAAIAGGDNGPNLNHLLGFINPAVESAGSDQVNDVVRENARLQATQLLADSAIIKDAAEQGNVQIVSAYYSLENGEVHFD